MKLHLILLSLFTLLCSFDTPTKVVRVIDGDTFEIETGERVRLLGIDAPEMSSKYGETSKQYLISLVEGMTVDLEPDHISPDTDVYNRLLRYVYLNGVDINEKMVLDGFAPAYLKYKVDKEDQYIKAEIIAKAAKRGIWGSDVNQGKDGYKPEAVSFWKSGRMYVVMGLVAILLIIGIIFYFKK